MVKGSPRNTSRKELDCDTTESCFEGTRKRRWRTKSTRSRKTPFEYVVRDNRANKTTSTLKTTPRKTFNFSSIRIDIKCIIIVIIERLSSSSSRRLLVSKTTFLSFLVNDTCFKKRRARAQEHASAPPLASEWRVESDKNVLVLALLDKDNQRRRLRSFNDDDEEEEEKEERCSSSPRRRLLFPILLRRRKHPTTRRVLLPLLFVVVAGRPDGRRRRRGEDDDDADALRESHSERFQR